MTLGRPPRNAGLDDERPLRSGGDWMPGAILRRFGPVLETKEELPRILVACGVIQGAFRVLEMCERLMNELAVTLPRIQKMSKDEALSRRSALLSDLAQRLEAAKKELPALRGRAANDAGDGKPNGLRQVDLIRLATHTEAVILACELAKLRNVTGIDSIASYVARSPDLAYAEGWLRRFMGEADDPRFLLFFPEDLKRLIVVYTDGRLGYDPKTDAGNL